MLGLDPSIQGSAAQVFVKLIPVQVVLLDQCDFPMWRVPFGRLAMM
jgi:hypothetical protein